MSYLPLRNRRLAQDLARPRSEDSASAALGSRIRRMLLIGLLVLTADWGSKAAMLHISPSSTIPHYTHPNVLALLLVLAVAPIVLRVVNTRLMMVGLGVCLGGCAGNLFERMAGRPVTDFIPLPNFITQPTCQVGHSCVMLCNLADLALWASVPLMVLAFAWRTVDTVSAARSTIA